MRRGREAPFGLRRGIAAFVFVFRRTIGSARAFAVSDKAARARRKKSACLSAIKWALGLPWLLCQVPSRLELARSDEVRSNSPPAQRTRWWQPAASIVPGSPFALNAPGRRAREQFPRCAVGL